MTPGELSVVSTIPALIDGLLKLWRKASFPVGVDTSRPRPLISDGYPNVDLEAEMIIIGNVQSTEVSMTMPNGRAETYEVSVYVEAGFTGQTAKEARDRAFGILGVMALEVRKDQTVGVKRATTGGQVWACGVGKVAYITTLVEQGYKANLEATLVVQALI